MVYVRELGAEPVVRGLHMLRDVADRLLRRRRTIVVLGRGNGVEREYQSATEDVGEAREGDHDTVERLRRRGGLGGERRGEEQEQEGEAAHGSPRGGRRDWSRSLIQGVANGGTCGKAEGRAQNSRPRNRELSCACCCRRSDRAATFSRSWRWDRS